MQITGEGEFLETGNFPKFPQLELENFRLEFELVLDLKQNENFSFFCISGLTEMCLRFFILDLIEL